MPVTSSVAGLPRGLHAARPWRLAATVSLGTTIAIGGSMIVVFLAVGLWLSGMGFASPGSAVGRPLTAWFVALGLVSVVAPPFVGGALWGAVTARFVGAPVGRAARTGSLAFGGMVLLTAAPTDLTQLLLDDLPSWMPLGVHGYFTLVFVVEVGVVAAVAAWRLARSLGVGGGAARIGVRTGIGAAIGFLLGSGVALALGIRVLPWRHLSMVWATVTALPVSTAVAGAVLGHGLHAAVGDRDDAAGGGDRRGVAG